MAKPRVEYNKYKPHAPVTFDTDLDYWTPLVKDATKALFGRMIDRGETDPVVFEEMAMALSFKETPEVVDEDHREVIPEPPKNKGGGQNRIRFTPEEDVKILALKKHARGGIAALAVELGRKESTIRARRLLLLKKQREAEELAQARQGT